MKKACGRSTSCAARIILGHELTHVLQKRSPEQYRKFSDMAVLAIGGGEKIAKYMHDYKLSREDAIDEIAADYAMKYLFSDEKTARNVTKHHSKLSQAIIDAISWIRDKLGIKTSDTDKLMRLYGKMYNDGRRNAGNAVSGDGVKNSIDNRKKKDYNEFDEALNRQQWAQFYQEVELREELGEAKEGIDLYFTESGTPKLVLYRYDSKAKSKVSVLNAFRSDSVLDNAISMLEKEYKNGSTENFHRAVYELYESGKLQQYDSEERSYLRIDDITGKATDVSGQGRGTGSTRNVGERTSASNSKNDDRIVGSNGITKKADSNESAFSNGKVKNSISGTERILEEGVLEIDELRGAYSSIDKIYASDKVRKNLTAKAENDLRNGEKALMNVIADAFSIPKENRNILRRAIMQYASKDILTGKEISSESVEKLFDFSLEEFEAVGLRVEKCSRDLHHSEFADGNVMTEYETNFSAQGMPIYFAEVHK